MWAATAPQLIASFFFAARFRRAKESIGISRKNACNLEIARRIHFESALTTVSEDHSVRKK
jgi:hypothetical protein